MNLPKKIWILSLCLLLPGTAVSQSVSTLLGSRSAGVGYASSTFRDEWSLLNNVGGLARLDQISASFAYESRPALPGANRMAAAFAIPVTLGVAGLSLFRFGDELYNEQIISVGYSNEFGLASLGLKFNYVQYRATGFRTRNALSIDLGGIAQLTPILSVGAYIMNVNQPRLSTIDQERLPTKLVAGIAFKPSENVNLLAEIEKDLQYRPTVKGGAEYLVNKKVTVRTGFTLHPNVAFFGLGFLFRKMKIDYSIQYSHMSSAAYQASVIYRLDKKSRHEK